MAAPGAAAAAAAVANATTMDAPLAAFQQGNLGFSFSGAGCERAREQL